MKKADNFDAKKWLIENKITFQSRLLKLEEEQKPSTAGDEFSLSCKIIKLGGAEYVNYNFKLVDVDFEEVEGKKPEEEEEKKGFLSKVGSKVGSFLKGKPTIYFYFEPADIKGVSADMLEEIKRVFISVKLKNDSFALLDWNTSEITAATIPDSTQASKFISYLLEKSQWKEGLNNTFGDMKTKLTPASLKK